VFVALVIQQSKLMSHILLSSLTCSTTFFYIISLATLFLEKMLLKIKCVLFSIYKICLKHFSFEKERSKILPQMHTGLQVTWPSFLSDINKFWIFSTDFRKILKCKISWKSFQRQPSCSMRTGWRTDIGNLIDAFCNFVKAPKIQFSIHSENKFFLWKSRRRTWGVELPLCSFLSLVLNINIIYNPINY
jgi:hypothetical protein